MSFYEKIRSSAASLDSLRQRGSSQASTSCESNISDENQPDQTSPENDISEKPKSRYVRTKILTLTISTVCIVGLIGQNLWSSDGLKNFANENYFAHENTSSGLNSHTTMSKTKTAVRPDVHNYEINDLITKQDVSFPPKLKPELEKCGIIFTNVNKVKIAKRKIKRAAKNVARSGMKLESYYRLPSSRGTSTAPTRADSSSFNLGSNWGNFGSTINSSASETTPEEEASTPTNAPPQIDTSYFKIKITGTFQLKMDARNEIQFLKAHAPQMQGLEDDTQDKFNRDGEMPVKIGYTCDELGCDENGNFLNKPGFETPQIRLFQSRSINTKTLVENYVDRDGNTLDLVDWYEKPAQWSPPIQIPTEQEIEDGIITTHTLNFEVSRNVPASALKEDEGIEARIYYPLPYRRCTYPETIENRGRACYSHRYAARPWTQRSVVVKDPNATSSEYGVPTMGKIQILSSDGAHVLKTLNNGNDMASRSWVGAHRGDGRPNLYTGYQSWPSNGRIVFEYTGPQTVEWKAPSNSAMIAHNGNASAYHNGMRLENKYFRHLSKNSRKTSSSRKMPIIPKFSRAKYSRAKYSTMNVTNNNSEQNNTTCIDPSTSDAAEDLLGSSSTAGEDLDGSFGCSYQAFLCANDKVCEHWKVKMCDDVE